MSEQTPHTTDQATAILGRIEKHLEKLDRYITGGDDPKAGLAFKVAIMESQLDATIPDRVHVLESERESREKRDAKRDTWTVGIGVTVASTILLMILPKLFAMLSTAH